jgi:predicted TIM-barrel fold metal-dependent hydrolase
LFGSDADLPIPREIVALAKKHNLIMHAHSDAEAVRRLFKQDPSIKVIWAHSGFDSPEEVARMLEVYPNLWADLAFRSDMGVDGGVNPRWEKVFEAFPKRLMVGTTEKPGRKHRLAKCRTINYPGVEG